MEYEGSGRRSSRELQKLLQVAVLVLLIAPLRSSRHPASNALPFSFVPSLLPCSRFPSMTASGLSARSNVHSTVLLRLDPFGKARRLRSVSGVKSTWKCVAGEGGSRKQDFTIAVSTVMGLESVVKQELEALGYSNSRAVGASGRVELEGGSEAIAKCNLHLRSATRVMLVMARFQATTFDNLFDGTNAVKWEDYIHAGASFPVRGKSVKSTLSSVPACQAIVKKAVVARLLGADPARRFKQDAEGWLQEDERVGIFGIEVSILNDEVTISLDTSGDALHRRGYRTGLLENGAPLKETLAASMLLLSKWTPDRPLLDPFCGSGTILLEAALMAHNMAPGISISVYMYM